MYVCCTWGAHASFTGFERVNPWASCPCTPWLLIVYVQHATYKLEFRGTCKIDVPDFLPWQAPSMTLLERHQTGSHTHLVLPIAQAERCGFQDEGHGEQDCHTHCRCRQGCMLGAGLAWLFGPHNYNGHCANQGSWACTWKLCTWAVQKWHGPSAASAKNKNTGKHKHSAPALMYVSRDMGSGFSCGSDMSMDCTTLFNARPACMVRG